MEILFTTESSVRRADEIVDYLLGPRLWIPQQDYPDFDAWVAKVHDQLKHEKKRALVAISQGRIVGVTIYQRHLAEPDALEIKNLTVRPDQQGRYVASFMVRNAEVEGMRDFGSRYALIDAKADNFGIRSFLGKHRYRPLGTMDLYGLGAGQDVVFRKDFGQLVLS